MKFILLLTLFLAANSLFGQVPTNLRQKAKLKHWIIPTSHADKLKILENMDNKELLEWVFYDMQEGNSSCIEDLHQIDFNCDGIADLVYYGYGGGESNIIIFPKGDFENKYVETIKLFGNIIEISDNDGFTPLTFTLFNYACCGGVVDHVEKYVAVWNNAKFTYELQAKYALYCDVDIPFRRFDKPIAFETINEKYFLRLNPYINDSIRLDHDEIGNIFAEYPKGSQGIAITSQTDKTGRIWWFVIMKNNVKPNWSLYVSGDNNTFPAYYLGWISSRYVKRLN